MQFAVNVSPQSARLAAIAGIPPATTAFGPDENVLVMASGWPGRTNLTGDDGRTICQIKLLIFLPPAPSTMAGNS